MAKKIVALEVQLTAGQAAKELDALTDKANEATNAVNGTEQGFKTLKQQLKEAEKEAQLMAEKFGDTSKQAIEAQKKVAKLKDEVGDFKSRVDALNPEAKFKAFAQVAQGVAGGFAAAQGAMALFGNESEEVQKILLKVQAAMALTQGIEAVAGLADSMKNFKVVALDAFGAIKKAILANPLLAVASALAAIGVAVYEWINAEDDLQKEIEQSRIAEEKRFELSQRAYDSEIALAKGLGVATEALERKKQEDFIANTKERLRLMKLEKEAEFKKEFDTYAMRATLGNKKVDLILKNADTFRKASEDELKLEKELADTEARLNNQRLTDIGKALKATIDNNTKKKESNKQVFEDEKAQIEELNRLREYAAKQSQKQITEDLQAWVETEQEKIRVAERTIKEQQQPFYAFEEEKLTALEVFNAALKKGADNFAEVLNGNFGKSQEFALATLTTNLSTANTFMDAAMNNQLNRVKGNEKAQEQIRKTYFERQKKMQIAQATISTLEGATNAFKSIAASPITTIFPAAPYLAAASALAQGFANIAQIKATTYEGGGGGSAGSQGGSGIPNLAAPESGAQQNIGTTQLPREQIEQGQHVVIQNQIVESEITNTQNRVNRIQARATID